MIYIIFTYLQNYVLFTNLLYLLTTIGHLLYSYCLYLRFNVDTDDRFTVVSEFTYKAVSQCGPLQNERRENEVISNAAETVALEERHEKSKADKHHNVNILKHCNTISHT